MRPRLFVKTGCPWCAEAKAVLDTREVPYEEINVSEDRTAMNEMVALSGQHRAPVLQWNGSVLADFGAAELQPFLAGKLAGAAETPEVTRVEPRPPFPPFTEETARKKVKMAEDAWNSKDPQRVALAYTPDSEWRNRDEFFRGRDQIVAFLTRKWAKEHDYRLRKDLWAFTGNRIAVRFVYEWHDDSGQWWRSHGNENWEFAPNGLMMRRFASINDQAITENDRELGERPAASIP
ncbi:MAG: DUF1348 family protein [Terrimicrobiaceae bacterium]|nr:DUF1348 family protein [Terrimicrobiaceae bacterium]